MEYKKIDLILKKDMFENILNFFNDRSKFTKSSSTIIKDNYNINIIFDESLFNDNLLNVCFTIQGDTLKSINVYINITEPHQLKYMCFRTDMNSDIVWMFNLSNMRHMYYMDISRLFSCQNINKVVCMLSIIDFSNEIQIKDFCNSIYDNIINFKYDDVLNDKISRLVLNKLNYFGFEEKSSNIYYYKSTLKRKETSDICSFIIHCLNTLLKNGSIDFIKNEIPEIGY